MDTRLNIVAGALILLSAACLPSAIAQKDDTRSTYTWIDENGRRVFSDRPPPDGEGARVEIDVPDRPSDPFASLQQRRPVPASETDEAEDSDAGPPISVSVVRPQPEEMYVNTGGRVQVGVNIQPSLPRDGRVVIYLDDALAATGSAGQQSFLLEPVFRGEHTLEAVVVDENGREITRSVPVTFFVRQASRLTPP
jgi:hypothetical protein